MKLVFLLFLVVFFHAVLCDLNKMNIDKDNDGKLSKEEEEEVLKTLHKNIDRDSSGTINSVELSELETISSSDTNKDSSVSLKELTSFWFHSPVHSWTEADVLKWLESTEFANYKDTFKAHKVSGKILPRLAMDDGKYLMEQMNVSHKDSKPLSLQILKLVFGIYDESSKLYEVLLGCVALVLALITAWYHQRQEKFTIEKRKIEEKLKQAEIEAQKTENMLKKKLQETVTSTQSIELKFKDVEREREQLDLVMQDKEKTANELRELLSNERKERSAISEWLNDKFQDEYKTWIAKWSKLYLQIEANRNSLKKTEKKSFIFSKTSKALEQNRQIDQLEVEIDKWRDEYKKFLDVWNKLSTTTTFEIYSLKDKIEEFENS